MIQEITAQPLVASYIAISILLAAWFLKRYYTSGGWTRLASAGIVGWSGVMYTNHLTNIVVSPTLYYFDWMFTTPLLVLVLQESLGETDNTVALAQFLTIFSAWLAFTADSYTVVLEAFSLAAFAYVIYNLVTADKAWQKPVLSGLIVATFLAYPAVYYYNDMSLIGITTTLVVLPFFSKHVFTVYKELRQ